MNSPRHNILASPPNRNNSPSMPTGIVANQKKTTAATAAIALLFKKPAEQNK